MSELPKHLHGLLVKLDYMGLRVEQLLCDALEAVVTKNETLAEAVIQGDEKVDQQEVEIERECIRLLALFQPAAVDLRRICFVIKVNSDLEQMADLCVAMAKHVASLAESSLSVNEFEAFQSLADAVTKALGKTIRLVGDTHDTATAYQLIEGDRWIDAMFRQCSYSLLHSDTREKATLDEILAIASVARALERLGDLCVNIAEDVVFLSTGEIIRHGGEKTGSEEDRAST